METSPESVEGIEGIGPCDNASLLLAYNFAIPESGEQICVPVVNSHAHAHAMLTTGERPCEFERDTLITQAPILFKVMKSDKYT
jgi:hypothetical protein